MLKTKKAAVKRRTFGGQKRRKGAPFARLSGATMSDVDKSGQDGTVDHGIRSASGEIRFSLVERQKCL